MLVFLRQLSGGLDLAGCRDTCHSCQISEAICIYLSDGPAVTASNQRTNSSWTTRHTSSADWQPGRRGKMLPASDSYSSGLTSKLMPTGSWRNSNAAVESNRSAYWALSCRRASRISSRVLGMGCGGVQTSWLSESSRCGSTVETRRFHSEPRLRINKGY